MMPAQKLDLREWAPTVLPLTIHFIDHKIMKFGQIHVYQKFEPAS